MIPAGACLLAGLATGIRRLGWALHLPMDQLHALHGPLMAVGFMGTLVALERAATASARWPLGAPLLLGSGGLLLMTGWPPVAGALVQAAGAAVLVILLVAEARRSGAAGPWLGVLAAALLLCGVVLLALESDLDRIAPLWMAFLVLTVTGERLELGAFRTSLPALFLVPGALGLAVGGLLGIDHPQGGAWSSGLSLALIAACLTCWDVQSRPVRAPGLPGFQAACLRIGYLWLLSSGLLWAWTGTVVAGPAYDAVLHCTFLGFVFSMVFAHAPSEYPRVLGIELPFRRAFWLPLWLLHGTLLLRVLGDLTGWIPGRHWGGLGNVVALLLFITLAASTACGAGKAKKNRAPGRARGFG